MMNALIDSANAAAEQWVAWVLATSLDAAVLFAVVVLVWFAIRNRVAPQVGYGLFLLVPLKLLMPVFVTVPDAMAPWTPSGLVWTSITSTKVVSRAVSLPSVDSKTIAMETEALTPSAPTLGSSVGSEFAARGSRQGAFAAETRSPSPIGAIAGAQARAGTTGPRLSTSAMLMIAWLGAVVLLLVRLAVMQCRFRASLRRGLPPEGSSLAVEVRELCRLAGVSETIRLVELDGIAAPAVWGIVRPTIVLPRGLTAALTADQLRWTLLHELAHIRRHDLIVVMLQRIAAVLHFFNPVVWVVNRVIHQLREFACDDLALALGRASAVESGEAFVRILRHAAGRGRELNGALGVFGLDSRGACLRRVSRLLDTGRPIRPAPGAWSFWGFVALAVISLPSLRAGSDDAPAKAHDSAKESSAPAEPKGKAPGDEARARNGQEFALRVLGPDRKPIPQAVVELGTYPRRRIELIRHGKFVRRELYGVRVATDDQGQLKVEFTSVPTHFNVYITLPGYGPYWAGWSSENFAEPIPSSFTAELDPAWSIGGIIVDSEGKPIKGAIVQPSIEFKKRPGANQQMGIGSRQKTDAAGRWHFDSVPVSMSDVHVNIDHPSFQPVRRRLTRAEFGIDRGQQPVAKVVMNRGLTVAGKVTDEAGKPIVGALVRTKYNNNIRQAKTGSDGVYRLVGCEPVATKVVVSAKGRATDMKELTIAADMGPVDFQMKPGGTVRIRVLDEKGNPVPRARIFFQQWRSPDFKYFEFDHASQYADQNGVWVWNEAPLDEFKADICRPDGMQLLRQSLLARAEEYVFRVSGELVVSGNVVDAVTHKPIREFRVTPGGRDNRSPIFWKQNLSFAATDGHYQIRQNRGELINQFRIEADGYHPAVSRDIKSDEGTISIDFALKPGARNVAAKVVTPRNLSAAGAKVALGIPGSQINVKNGEINDMQTYCTSETTDGTGSFHFPPQNTDFQIVITHPSGFAHIASGADWETKRIIHLEPWARVEGTFRVGKAPAPNVTIGLDVSRLNSFERDEPRIFTQHRVVTGPDGRFVFDRVIPGRGRIGRDITFMVDEGALEVTSACMIPANFPAGQTVHIDLGGTGRAVTGKLKPQERFAGKVRWNFASVFGQRRGMMPAFAPEDATLKSGVRISLAATVDRDGKFRIDDVPPGDYSLSVWFQREHAGRLNNHRFTVPPVQPGGPEEPVDLGTLTLQKP